MTVGRRASVIALVVGVVLLLGAVGLVLLWHPGTPGGPAALPGIGSPPDTTSNGDSPTPEPSTSSPSAMPSSQRPSPTSSPPTGTPTATGPAPIGAGWTEIFPSTQLDHPPGLVRHELINGEHHFWVLATDPSAYPGRDSGPRSELRFFNDYTTGQAQFQAEIKVMSGCSRASIMQVFGAPDRATAFMAWAMPNDLAYYSGAPIYAPLYDQYLRLNVIHDTATGQINVYVNGIARGTFQDHGAANHYFKLGVYHQKGMSDRCDVYARNIHIFKKS